MAVKIAIFFLVQLCFWSSSHAHTEIILDRYREYLFRTYELNTEEIDQWTGSFDYTSQKWPDINYPAAEHGNWQLLRHLRRTRSLSLAWAKPDSPYYHSEEVWKNIDAALDHWLEKRYMNPNWWHNQIGVPQIMRDIIIALGDKLTGQQLKEALEVMAQLYVNEEATGANLIWPADLGLHYGALTGNEGLVDHTRKLILKEIKVTTSEGIQPDYSFHQHGPRLQMYQYGKAYFWESVRIAWQLRETPRAFPDKKVDILIDFILDGWQWMARGVDTVPGTMDRSSSRVGELRAADLRPLIPFMAELRPEKSVAFKQLAAIQNGEGALAGFRYYPRSDFTVYHRPDFSFFLKTISSRTLATESINRENLKGKLLNSGDAYLIHNGNEYYNLMPVWDWTRLPGITSFNDADIIDRKQFTGSVGDGNSGLTVMDYNIINRDTTQSLSARKMWASYGNTIVALIANLRTENVNGNAFTALDQARWQGEVTVNEPGNTLKAGNHKLDNLQWIHHNHLAYIPVEPSSFNLQLNEITGSWSSINASEPATPVTEKVFLPVMHHDVGHNPLSTGYVLAYSETPEQTKALAENPVWEVLRNDKDGQAVRFGADKFMIAFYAPGTIKLDEFSQLSTDRACLILISNEGLYVSDPAQRGGTVKIRISDKEWSIDVPENGTTVKKAI